MKRHILILAACACACAFAGVMSARLGSLGRNDTVVTNVTDVTPGNYETVSNAAMSARGKTDLEVYAADTTPWTCSDVRASGDYSTMTNKSLWTFTTWEFEGYIYPTISYNGVVIGDCNSPMQDEDMPTASFWGMDYDENLFVNFSRHIAGMATGNRLATTSDIPTAVSADLTPATNYANKVGARVAVDATNYTDTVATNIRQSYIPISGSAITDVELFMNQPLHEQGQLRLELPGGDNVDAESFVSSSQITNQGAVVAAEAMISTNNAAFVAAVTNCPVSHQGGGGADWPIGDFGQYGTIGAIIAALVAASTWLKSHLRYELHDVVLTGGAGTLLDRAGNRVVVTGDTTLTLPAAVAGYCRDFLVRLEISGSTVPTITFSPDGNESVTYETDGDEFPVPDEAGDWLYSFTESCVAHKFAVSLKKVNEVAAPQAQGGV